MTQFFTPALTASMHSCVVKSFRKMRIHCEQSKILQNLESYNWCDDLKLSYNLMNSAVRK